MAYIPTPKKLLEIEIRPVWTPVSLSDNSNASRPRHVTIRTRPPYIKSEAEVFFPLSLPLSSSLPNSCFDLSLAKIGTKNLSHFTLDLKSPRSWWPMLAPTRCGFSSPTLSSSIRGPWFLLSRRHCRWRRRRIDSSSRAMGLSIRIWFLFGWGSGSIGTSGFGLTSRGRKCWFRWLR